MFFFSVMQQLLTSCYLQASKIWRILQITTYIERSVLYVSTVLGRRQVGGGVSELGGMQLPVVHVELWILMIKIYRFVPSQKSLMMKLPDHDISSRIILFLIVNMVCNENKRKKVYFGKKQTPLLYLPTKKLGPYTPTIKLLLLFLFFFLSQFFLGFFY